MLVYRRELYGRGVIGLVKSSHWYQQLQESQQLSLPAIGDAVRVQARTFLCCVKPMLHSTFTC